MIINTEKQSLQDLKGNLKKVHLFAEKNCTKETCVKERGNHKTTKYFQIPLALRPRKKNYQKITYQKIENKKFTYYIYGLISE
jgi:hypothetical protein